MQELEWESKFIIDEETTEQILELGEVDFDGAEHLHTAYFDTDGVLHRAGATLRVRAEGDPEFSPARLTLKITTNQGADYRESRELHIDLGEPYSEAATSIDISNMPEIIKDELRRLGVTRNPEFVASMIVTRFPVRCPEGVFFLDLAYSGFPNSKGELLEFREVEIEHQDVEQKELERLVARVVGTGTTMVSKYQRLMNHIHS